MAKLLLIKDVQHLGRRGDLVSVKNGYARNFLLPRSLAVTADAKALARQAAMQEERRLEAAKDKQEAEVVAQKLVTVTLKVEVKVDQDGNMYGSVSSVDIVRLLQEQAQITVEKSAVLLTHALKKTGTHKVAFKLNEGVPAEVNLKIFAEGTSSEEESVAETNINE